jgi:hypothetical protein
MDQTFAEEPKKVETLSYARLISKHVLRIRQVIVYTILDALYLDVSQPMRACRSCIWPIIYRGLYRQGLGRGYVERLFIASQSGTPLGV